MPSCEDDWSKMFEILQGLLKYLDLPDKTPVSWDKGLYMQKDYVHEY